MAITFKYKRIERKEEEGHNSVYVYTPSIPVTLVNGGEAIDVVALIDSGADHCIIPRGLAELLDLDLSKAPEDTKGIGGSVQAVPTFMNIVVQNSHERYSIKVPASVLMQEDTDIPPILGRVGFFDEFEIRFKQKQLKVILKKVFNSGPFATPLSNASSVKASTNLKTGLVE
ncbi:hypothetical protein IPdc08_01350 [archaeon]|nr:hypothetical protein IPdc08_01350 [archaeon]